MAQNIFEQYGLKEVANVTFYDIATKAPVLFLDTLKVSTIEESADSVDARGGWGNPTLITWDYNKSVNVTLEDALMSPASLTLMNGAARKVSKNSAEVVVNKTEELVTDSSGKVTLSQTPIETEITGITADGETVTSASVSSKDVTFTGKNQVAVRVFYSYKTAEDAAVEITIDAATFPGTYKIVGDTVVRSQKTGKDEPFQFVIEKAKLSSNVTFTMQAEGDPATFSMSLKALRDEDGNMFKLIKYTA